MSIKRILKPVMALTLASFIFSTAGLGQTRKHDVSFQFGFGSSDQVVDIFEDIIYVVITLGSYSKENMNFTGVPFLTYHYSPNSRFGFGGSLGYYGVSGDLATSGGSTIVGNFRESNYIAAAELDYHWIMRPGLQVYSGAGLGIRIRRGSYTQEAETDKVTATLPTFHLNALGVRIGKQVGFFAELGFGYKSVLAFGVNGQF